MHLTAVVESEDHVCCRYRLSAFRAALASAGHMLEIRPWPRRTLARLMLGRGWATDAIIVQRKLLPRLAVTLLRRRGPRLIFDFDDALWLRDSYSAKGFDSPRRARRFRGIVRACDLVIAGNEYLAAEARRWTLPDRVTVIPTCVNVTTYPSLPRPHRTGLQLVWVGSSSTLRGLEQFAPTLAAIGRAVPGTRLKLICDRFLEIPDLPVDRCEWSESSEAAEIASADVGIGWVPDDPWSRGKCGLKLLQYQAAGLPVIANPVGVQAQIVRDGMTGIQAATTEQWVKAVRRLAVDPGLRQQLGAAGREQVEANYSIAAGARKWLAALDALTQTFRRTG